MIFTTGPLAPRGAYNDSSNRRFASSTVGIPVLRFSTLCFFGAGAPTIRILRAVILVWPLVTATPGLTIERGGLKGRGETRLLTLFCRGAALQAAEKLWF